MGYERRGASFNFMGFVPIGKTIEVVPDDEETAALIQWPPPGRQSVGGTVALRSEEFARGLRLRPSYCRINVK